MCVRAYLDIALEYFCFLSSLRKDSTGWVHIERRRRPFCSVGSTSHLTVVGQLTLTKSRAASIAGARAQYGGYGGYGGGNGGYRGGSGGNGEGFGNGNFGNFQNGAGFDIDAAMRARTIHGILGALAMVILFPVGSILMRVVPGRFAIWIHGLAQIVAYAVYIAAVAMGIYMVRQVRLPNGGDLVRFLPCFG